MFRQIGPGSRGVTLLATGLLLTGGAGLAGAADAGESDQAEPRIEQIVVVAHKSERSIRRVAANVTALSRSELADELAGSVADVFRYVPGVDHEAAGTRFGTEGISIRGIGGNRVAIVVDGVPLSDQFDVGSFSNATRDFIDAGLVQDIEVLHGPASALYGSAAIGGVVAVRTPDPFDIVGPQGRGGEIGATWRSADSSLQGQALAAFGDRSLGLVAGASWRQGEQVDSAAAEADLDTRDSIRRTALLKLVGDNRFGHSWRAQLIHQESATRTDLRSILGTGRYRSTTALEGDDRYLLDALIVAYEFGAPGGWFDSGVLRSYLELADVEQFTLDERGNASTPVSIDRLFAFEQRIRGAELNLWKTLDGGRVEHRVGLGLEYRERRTEEYRDGLSTDLSTGATTNDLLGEVFPLRDFPISTTRELGAFIEDTLSIGDWTVIAALRADRFRLTPENDPMYFADYPFAEPVSLDEADISPKVGVIYRLRDSTDIYLQYSHGFRAPPYADANIGLEIPAFNYRAIPNPELRSESSNGIDLGLRWQGPRSTLRLAAFHTRYDDFIESRVRVGIDPVSGRVLFQSQNLRETRIKGFEMAWTMRLGGDLDGLEIDASGYYARGRNLDSGEALNSVGPPQAVAGATWTSADGRRQWRLRATLTDAWSERDESAGELFDPPGHAVVDLYFSQRVGSRTTLRAGLQNLTDRRYWTWSDVRGIAPGDPILPTLARAGRNASLSLNVNW